MLVRVDEARRHHVPGQRQPARGVGTRWCRITDEGDAPGAHAQHGTAPQRLTCVAGDQRGAVQQQVEDLAGGRRITHASNSSHCRQLPLRWRGRAGAGRSQGRNCPAPGVPVKAVPSHTTWPRSIVIAGQAFTSRPSYGV